MSYEKVMQASNLIIGTKQTLKALEIGEVLELIVAEDADTRVVHKVETLAKSKKVPIHYVDSMKKLGKACGIEVGAATVALRE
ncbi:50S ribosomal protein L7ae-like protein [Alkalihalophilus sp. As8PL]|uniref:RNA-binding protein AB3N04_10780 n=2 Tax=Alkalihalophilus TaxID=2893060 RepID=A0AB39BYQ6_9BACI|nr:MULTISPECIES: 50S ribosomal protein L7ae-like protein [Bacillaceae]KMJ56252.1 ribosomal protein L7Ae-like protein [Bacillus sp. LL01]MDV2686700.1 50S ribosomal protein L7ae-like protein [Alkalihalophilus lindianensis]